MSAKRDRRPRPGSPDSGALYRFAGAGLELGGGIVGCVLLGWWIDRTFNTGNKGIVVCAVLGIVGGMYHLISRAYKLNQQLGKPADHSRRGENDRPDRSNDESPDSQ